MKFSQKMPLCVFYTMVQKSQKWPKTQIKGGPALILHLTFLASRCNVCINTKDKLSRNSNVCHCRQINDISSAWAGHTVKPLSITSVKSNLGRDLAAGTAGQPLNSVVGVAEDCEGEPTVGRQDNLKSVALCKRTEKRCTYSFFLLVHTRLAHNFDGRIARIRDLRKRAATNQNVFPNVWIRKKELYWYYMYIPKFNIRNFRVLGGVRHFLLLHTSK